MDPQHYAAYQDFRDTYVSALFTLMQCVSPEERDDDGPDVHKRVAETVLPSPLKQGYGDDADRGMASPIPGSIRRGKQNERSREARRKSSERSQRESHPQTAKRSGSDHAGSELPHLGTHFLPLAGYSGPVRCSSRQSRVPSELIKCGLKAAPPPRGSTLRPLSLGQDVDVSSRRSAFSAGHTWVESPNGHLQRRSVRGRVPRRFFPEGHTAKKDKGQGSDEKVPPVERMSTFAMRIASGGYALKNLAAGAKGGEDCVVKYLPNGPRVIPLISGCDPILNILLVNYVFGGGEERSLHVACLPGAFEAVGTHM